MRPSLLLILKKREVGTAKVRMPKTVLVMAVTLKPVFIKVLLI